MLHASVWSSIEDTTTSYAPSGTSVHIETWLEPRFSTRTSCATATRVDIDLFLPSGRADDDEIVSTMFASLMATNDEDVTINERVRAGMSSRWAKLGPLSQLD